MPNRGCKGALRARPTRTCGAPRWPSECLGVSAIPHDTPIALLLAYFKPEGAHPAWAAFESEIAKFATLVAGDPYVTFESVSYSSLWSQWSQLLNPPSWLGVHLDELKKRYAVSVPG